MKFTKPKNTRRVTHTTWENFFSSGVLRLTVSLRVTPKIWEIFPFRESYSYKNPKRSPSSLQKAFSIQKFFEGENFTLKQMKTSKKSHSAEKKLTRGTL